MENILILGSLPKNTEDKELYESIVGICREYTDKIVSPLDTIEFTGTDTERYERGLYEIRKSDIIIGENSKPSTGQGIELRESTIHDKPVIIIAKEGSSVSGMIKGMNNVIEMIFYSDMNDLSNKLNYKLKEIIVK